MTAVEARGEYPNFAALTARHREGEDFDRIIVARERVAVAVIAPHGGRIEVHTDQIAQEIARDDFSLYCFISRRRSAETNLHITSHNFDDPDCLALLARHTSAVAIHGCSGDQPEVLLGGLDSALANEFAVALRRDGINVRATGHDFPGTRPLNICNRTASQAGVQFELTMSCREGAQRARFVAAVRRVLLERELAA